MSEKKWAAVMSSVSMLMDLQRQQMEVFENMVNILMDEDGQNATEANEKVLGSLRRPIREQ